MNKILVSACTVGIATKFDGGCLDIATLRELVDWGTAIPFCAEVSAGFSVPRKPAEIEPGKTAVDVLNGNAKIYEIGDPDGNLGADVTEMFLQGAHNTLKVCIENGITLAVLRENSPSCGSSLVYDGQFKGNKIDGSGVVAQLLRNNGITVYSHENVPEDLIKDLLQSKEG